MDYEMQRVGAGSVPTSTSPMLPTRNSRLGDLCRMILVFFIPLLLGSFIFGIIEALEMQMTGEYTWAPGHGELYRVCVGNPGPEVLSVHTCNVFKPTQSADEMPYHSFVESNRRWDDSEAQNTGTTSAISLQELLQGIHWNCSRTTEPTISTSIQIIVGKVGFGHSTNAAYACNYDSNGNVLGKKCGTYNDGGLPLLGTTYPSSLNSIMSSHFGMTCNRTTN